MIALQNKSSQWKPFDMRETTNRRKIRQAQLDKSDQIKFKEENNPSNDNLYYQTTNGGVAW